MSLRIALALCGAVVIVLVALISVERRRFKTVVSRTKRLRKLRMTPKLRGRQKPTLPPNHPEADESDDQVIIVPQSARPDDTEVAADDAEPGALPVHQLATSSKLRPDIKFELRDDARSANDTHSHIDPLVEQVEQVGQQAVAHHAPSVPDRMAVDVSHDRFWSSTHAQREPLAAAPNEPGAITSGNDDVIQTERTASDERVVSLDAAPASEENHSDNAADRESNVTPLRTDRDDVEPVDATQTKKSLKRYQEHARELESTLDRELKEVEDAVNKTLTPSFDVNQISEDPQIDFVAHLFGPKQLAQRQRVLKFYREGEIDIPKAHRLFGLSHPTSTWVDVEHDAETARYSELVLTMQLADHSGCATESELTRFSDIVYNLSEQNDCQLRFSQPLDDAVEQGRKLQAFCQKFDVLAIVNIMVPEGRVVDGAEIHRAALDLDMHPGNMKIYHRTSGSGALAKERFSLANMFQPGTFDLDEPSAVTTRGVSLFLNVPRTIRPVDAFDEMAVVARELCARFDAQLVDQERKHLGDHGMNVIRATIARLADDMEQAEVLPGGEVAERLF